MDYEDDVEIIFHEPYPVTNTQRVTLKCLAWFPPDTAEEILLNALTGNRTTISKNEKESQ